MDLNADVDVVHHFFDRCEVEKIAIEELAEKRPHTFNRIWCHAWRCAEEYHRECQKKRVSPKQDAVNRHLRLS